jgi:F5/8 type C domain
MKMVNLGLLCSALLFVLATQSGAAESLPKRRPAPTEGAICANFSTPAGTDRYCVSSVLQSDPNVNRFNYGPESLFDHALNTAWVEGVDGQGIGEWIVVDFDGPRLVKDIQIENGYNKDPIIYQKNSRVKDIKVEFSGREKRSVTLKDTGTSQSIALPSDQPLKAYWVKFTIESVYPGSTWQDTAISELLIVSEPVQP